MIFMKVENDIPNGIELDLGGDETPLQDLIDEQSFYKVDDVTVYDADLQKIEAPINYTLNDTIVEKAYTVTDKTLIELQSEKKNEMSSGFYIDCKKGFTTNSIKMDSDITDVLSFDGGVRLAENLSSATIDVRDYDNVVHTVTIAESKTMVDDLGVNYQTLLSKKWLKNIAIDSATTVSDVGNVTWA